MADIVSFQAEKEARQPHWSGPCICLKCKHEWIGVGPLPMPETLKCPSCNLYFGVAKGDFDPPDNSEYLKCDNCDNMNFIIWRYPGQSSRVLCRVCGSDLTDVI